MSVLEVDQRETTEIIKVPFARVVDVYNVVGMAPAVAVYVLSHGESLAWVEVEAVLQVHL